MLLFSDRYSLLQFSRLKSLTLPTKIKLGKTGLRQLAKQHPNLEEINLQGCKAKDADIAQAAKLWPDLSSFGLDMYHVTNDGICQMVSVISHQLTSLQIDGDTTHVEPYLSNVTVETIAKCCPRLQVFSYRLSPFYYDASLDQLTERGIIALVTGCPKLKALELHNSATVGLEAFETIVRLQNENRLRLRHLFVAGTTSFRCARGTPSIPTLLQEEGSLVRTQLRNCGIGEVYFLPFVHNSAFFGAMKGHEQLSIERIKRVPELASNLLL